MKPIDPVICEVAYSWWCPPGGLVVDPWCVDTTRGLVAAKMGRRYRGFGMREAGVEVARRAELDLMDGEVWCDWLALDIRDAPPTADAADFVFSVPPEDLGAKDYRDTIARACAMLAPNRFACFVVGDLRDSGGFLRNLPGDTVVAFTKAGLRYYDEAIMVLSPGGVPKSAPKDFAASRKLASIHKKVLCFVKGDPLAATAAVGKCEFGRGIVEDDDDDEVEGRPGGGFEPPSSVRTHGALPA